MRKIFHTTIYAITVMVGVAMLIFILFQGLGDPAKMLAGQSGSKQTLQTIQEDLHLNEPKWKQLLLYLNDISPISTYTKSAYLKKELKGITIGSHQLLVIKWPYFGKSYQRKKSVSSILYEALPGTIILAISAMLLAVFFGLTMGIIAALKKDKWQDRAVVLTAISGISAPSFFMAILFAYVFGILLHPYTGLHFSGSLYEIDDITGEKKMVLSNVLLPAITLGIRPLAIIAQLTRSSMLDVLNKDYIRTAMAKGLNKKKVILKHALPNALNPIITAVTGWMAELLAGSFFVEYIFGWHGLGKITVEALEKLDYPLVMGSVLMSAFIFVLISLAGDKFYRIIDPRIR